MIIYWKNSNIADYVKCSESEKGDNDNKSKLKM